MPKVIIELRLGPNEILKYYQGIAQTLIAPSVSGQRIQLPASAIRSFVTPLGIHGRFEVNFSETGKLIDIVQIGS
jgi:hypothetical protein